MKDQFKDKIDTLFNKNQFKNQHSRDRRLENYAKKYLLVKQGLENKQGKVKYLDFKQEEKCLTAFENDIIVDKSSKTIYLPGYMRIKVKNINSLNLEQLTAEVNCDIIFNIYTGVLSQEIRKVISQKVTFLFQKNQPLKVVEKDGDKRNLEIKVSNSAQEIKLTLRKLFKTKISSNIFWTPFNVLNMILSITVQPIRYTRVIPEQKKQQNWLIKINLMDHLENYYKFSFNENIHYGDFRFAPYLSKCFYSNKKVSSSQDFKFSDARQHQKIRITKFQNYKAKIEQNNKKLFKAQEQEDQIQTFNSKLRENFQYAHFNIPMYKVPYESIVTIFLPLLLLGIINLCIFFQDKGLSSRIAAVASLMIAFVAIVPVVRAKIEPNPSITIIQIMVYMQTFSCLLTFFHSMIIRKIQNYQIQYGSDGLLFITSLILNLLIVLIILILIIHHQSTKSKFLEAYPWYPQNKKVSFKRQEWFNTLCYQNFKNTIQNQQQHYTQIKYLVDQKKLAKRSQNDSKDSKK